jgi:hypothetical protein
LFADFLLFFYEDADKLFDFDRNFEFLDKELSALASGVPPAESLYVDKLVKVFSRTGGEHWLLVHIEVQGYADHSFPRRMFRYFYRILDRFDREIRALVIFTDSQKNFRPDRYELVSGETSLVYRFGTYKVMDQDRRLLGQSDNPFAIVILTALVALERRNKSGDEMPHLTVELARLLLAKGFAKQKVRRLLQFIKHYVHFNRPEEISKFEELSERIDPNAKTMGIIEQLNEMYEAIGHEKGMEKGMELAKLEHSRLVVRNLLQQTDLGVSQIASVADVSESFVLELQRELAENK